MSFSVYLVGMDGGVSSIAGRLGRASTKVVIFLVGLGIDYRLISSYNGGNGLGLQEANVTLIDNVLFRGDLLFDLYRLVSPLWGC